MGKTRKCLEKIKSLGELIHSFWINAHTKQTTLRWDILAKKIIINQSFDALPNSNNSEKWLN